MVMIDQVCWNEMGHPEELELRCQDPDCRFYEEIFRRTLFQWRHFPVDMVVEPFINVPMAIIHSGYGIKVKEEIAVMDATNDVVATVLPTSSRRWTTWKSCACRSSATTRPKPRGGWPWLTSCSMGSCRAPVGSRPEPVAVGPDRQWMGVENALYTIIDQPELMHALTGRLTDGFLRCSTRWKRKACCVAAKPDPLHRRLDRRTARPWLRPGQKPRAKDMWTFGMAQMFSTVSPRMFKEYEVDYISRSARALGWSTTAAAIRSTAR